MTLPPIEEVATQEEAQDLAIAWQHWASDQSMYQSEVIEYATYFRTLAEKFDLVEEFEENAII